MSSMSQIYLTLVLRCALISFLFLNLKSEIYRNSSTSIHSFVYYKMQLHLDPGGRFSIIVLFMKQYCSLDSRGSDIDCIVIFHHTVIIASSWIPCEVFPLFLLLVVVHREIKLMRRQHLNIYYLIPANKWCTCMLRCYSYWQSVD